MLDSMVKGLLPAASDLNVSVFSLVADSSIPVNLGRWQH